MDDLLKRIFNIQSLSESLIMPETASFSLCCEFYAIHFY